MWAYSSKRESYQFMNLSMSDRTECIGEPSVEGTPSPLVIWVVLHEEVDLAVLSFWHHVLFQIGLHFSVGPSRPISPVRNQYQRASLLTLCSLWRQKIRCLRRRSYLICGSASCRKRGKSNTPVISGTFATWPRRTEYCGGSVRKTPSTRGNHASTSPCGAIKLPVTQQGQGHYPSPDMRRSSESRPSPS